MGLSSKKQTSETKPVFSSQIEGAANNISSAYGGAAPKIGAISDMIGSLAPDVVKRYQLGDPLVNDAASYNSDVLSGKYLGANPHLDSIVSNSNDAARNAVTASLGTRGLTGGSAMSDIISRNIAQNTTNLYGQNYENERARMGQASALAPTLSAAREIPLTSLLSILQAQGAPLQAANQAGAGVGGLLGQYTKGKQTYTPSLMDSIGQAINIGKAAAGFF